MSRDEMPLKPGGQEYQSDLPPWSPASSGSPASMVTSKLSAIAVRPHNPSTHAFAKSSFAGAAARTAPPPSSPATSAASATTTRRSIMAASLGTASNTALTRRGLGFDGRDDARQAERDQDDRPVRGVDPERRRVPEHEHVVDEPEQHDAGEGAEHPPAPALERDPADHGGREHGEDQVVALVGGDGDHLAGDHQPGDRGQHAGDGEDADPDAVDLDAGGARRLDVAADRVDRPAGAVEAQEEGGD